MCKKLKLYPEKYCRICDIAILEKVIMSKHYALEFTQLNNRHSKRCNHLLITNAATLCRIRLS